jgi:hypothetical protein
VDGRHKGGHDGFVWFSRDLCMAQRESGHDEEGSDRNGD